MNFDKIKNLVKQNGDKFVFVENGEPEIVMMSFGEYQKLAQRDPNARGEPSRTIRVSSELSEYYSEHSDELGFFGSAKESADSVGLPVRLEDIRLEDLPI